jgi:hypothetical protein
VDRQQLKFAEKMVAELRRAGDTGPLEIDEEQFRIVRGSQIFFNLHNAYAEWQSAPRLRRNAVLRFFAASLLEPSEPPESVDEARPNLLPRVRELEWYEVMKLQFADARDGRGPGVVYEPLNEELALEIVYDLPTAVMSVAPEARRVVRVLPRRDGLRATAPRDRRFGRTRARRRSRSGTVESRDARVSGATAAGSPSCRRKAIGIATASSS